MSEPPTETRHVTPMTPMTPIPPVSAAEHERLRRQRQDDERMAIDHLSRLNGALQLQAAVLALILPVGSRRAVRAWQIECEGVLHAEALREQIGHLSAPARLPHFEALVLRMRAQPLAARQALLEATRRVMGARGTVRPIDRLHWLAMRQGLGAPSGAGARHATAADLAQLPQSDVAAIAAYSAFLSRIVPIDTGASTPGAPGSVAPAADPATRSSADTAVDSTIDTAAATPGAAWYDTAMAPWRANAAIPPCRPPDSDGLVSALNALQALPWMQRPMLLRGWVAAALQHSRYGRLGTQAADALRLSGALLDSPLPPELARLYGDAAEVPR